MNYDTHHARFRDDIGAFLAGGLGDADRRAFEDHAANCPSRRGARRRACRTPTSRDSSRPPGRATGWKTDSSAPLGTARPCALAGLRIGLHPAIRRARRRRRRRAMLGGFGSPSGDASREQGRPADAGTYVVAGTVVWRPAHSPAGPPRLGNETRGGCPTTYYKEVAGKEVAVNRQPATTPQEMARHFNEAVPPVGGKPRRLRGGSSYRASNDLKRLEDRSRPLQRPSQERLAARQQLDAILLPAAAPKAVSVSEKRKLARSC